MNTERYYAKDIAVLRKWLVDHHLISTGVWLVYDKILAGKRTLAYSDMVEELLCFGWIDSLPRALSSGQAMYYISPRKPKSPWSKLNKQRIKKLIDEKQITAAGLEVVDRSKKDGSWTSYDAVEDLILPLELRKAFLENKKAETNFTNFSNSDKKQVLWYIASAKHEETKYKRIGQIVSEAEKNNNPLKYRKNKKSE